MANIENISSLKFIDFFSQLEKESQTNLFFDVIKKDNIELAEYIYKNIQFENNKTSWSFIENVNKQVGLKTIQLSPFLNESINGLNIEMLKLCFKEMTEGQSILSFNDKIFPNNDNFHALIELVELICEEQRHDWINLIVSRLENNSFIEFNQNNLFDLQILHPKFQIILLAHSNLFEFVNLPYFDLVSQKNQQELTFDTTHEEIIYHALINGVSTHQFQLVLDFFPIETDENMEKLWDWIIKDNLFFRPLETLSLFLEYYEIDFIDLINSKSENEKGNHYSFHNVFSSLSDIYNFRELFEKSTDKISFFNDTEQLIFSLGDINSFLNLDETYEHLIYLLKFSSFYEQNMENSDLLLAFYQKLTNRTNEQGEDIYKKHDFNYSDFEEFFIKFEHDIMKMKLERHENIETNNKKIKL
jgi:hypothetical protein